MSRKINKRVRKANRQAANPNKAQGVAWIDIIEMHGLVKGLIETSNHAVATATDPKYVPYVNRFALLFDVQGLNNDMVRYVTPVYSQITDRLNEDLKQVKNLEALITDEAQTLKMIDYFSAIHDLKDLYERLILPTVVGLTDVAETAATLLALNQAQAEAVVTETPTV